MRFAQFDHQAFFPSQFWAYPKGTRLDEVSGDLKRPDGPALLVTDLKRWMLDPRPSERTLAFTGGPLMARKLSYERALTLFFDSVLLQSGIDATQPIWLLLPALGDEQRRSYRALLRRTVESMLGKDAQINFLFEPDMTLEYFRLIRGELALDPDENNLFLIVDCGALTCNMTMAISTRHNEITTGTTGTDRRHLQSVPGESVAKAGRYVDERLWRDACSALGLAFEENRDRTHLAEQTKIAVARHNEPHSLRSPERPDPWVLSPERLEEQSEHLWDIYRPTLNALLERTYEQLLTSPDSADLLARRGVRDARGLGRALHGVVLAGGSSQLPGFATALRKHLALTDAVPMFRVEAEYPVVASVGAMGHILHRKGLLRTDRGDPLAVPQPLEIHGELVNALQDDVYLAWRERAKGSDLHYELLFSRVEWPHAFLQADVERSLDGWHGKMIEYALVWGPDGAQRGEFVPKQAKRWTDVDCRGHAPKLRIRAEEGGDTLRFRFVKSSQKGAVYYMNQARAPEEARRADPPRNGGRHHKLSAVESEDVVIDFGMSKTIVLLADRAMDIDPEEFRAIGAKIADRAVLPGWRIEPTKQVALGLARSNAAVELPPEPPVTRPAAEEAPALATEAEPAPTVPTPPAKAEEDPPAIAPEPAPLVEPAPEPEPLPPVGLPRVGPDERAFLKAASDLSAAIGAVFHGADLVFLHLACKVRPLVLLAGPSGAGKTTLAQLYAHALGCLRPAGLAKVGVQAHWVDDSKFSVDLGPMLTSTRKHADRIGVLLLDEMNLARPEFYLTRWLLAIDDTAPDDADEMAMPRTPEGVARVLTIGTLNVDEWSRPPADKILDRAFLIEPTFADIGDDGGVVGSIRWISPPGVVDAATWAVWCALPDPLPALPDEVIDLMKILRLHDEQHARSIHESMQPSRRALLDVRRLFAYWQRLAPPGLSREELLDRAVAARVIPKFRGDARTWQPLLDRLKTCFRDCRWSRCSRTLEVLTRQQEEGFVSFWG